MSEHNFIKKAFSIIELSFLMTIVSLLALAYFATTSNSIITNSNKINITKERMLAIENAIINFQNQYGRLPCGAPIANPLFGNNLSKSYDTGNYAILADDDYLLNTSNTSKNSSFTNTSLNGNECLVYESSGVPTRALSLPAEYALDAWNNKIAYIVCHKLCGNNSLSVKNCTMASYQQNEGCITIKNSSSGYVLTSNAAYVLISYGANANGAININGTSSPNSIDADELINSYTKYINYGSNPVFIAKTSTSDFDDIVYFKTKNQINSMAVDTGLNPISLGDCQDNSKTLASINFTTSSSAQQSNGTYLIRQNLTVTERKNANLTNTCSASANTYNCGDEAVLGIMWAVQDICSQIYTLTPSCPGGGTYNSSTNSCSCPNNTWSGGGC
jgi:type II secretory pathway pseudopilin PulG